MSALQVLRMVPGAAPPRILVVDDQEANRVLLSRLLGNAGFAVREAENGEEAVELAQEWLPRAVLMDLQMPVLDGLAATRLIKQSEWGLAMVVIVVSASHSEVNLAQAYAAGAIAFIGKPFTDGELLTALGTALGLIYA